MRMCSREVSRPRQLLLQSLRAVSLPRYIPRVCGDNRGLALLAVLGVGFLLTLTVAGFLILTSNHASTGRYSIERLKARYAADAGVSWVYAQLVPNSDPAFSAPAATDLRIAYPTGPQDMAVDVVVECSGGGSPPCPNRVIRSRVNYRKF